jgi:hypothetical protein
VDAEVEGCVQVPAVWNMLAEEATHCEYEHVTLGVAVLDVGVCPYFSAVPNHRHVLQSRVTDSCLFLDILDITDVFQTFSFWTPVLLDWLCLLWVA